jgi:hypothetical protein
MVWVAAAIPLLGRVEGQRHEPLSANLLAYRPAVGSLTLPPG